MKNAESQEESYHCTACNNYISAEHGGDYCCDMLLCCDGECLAIHKLQNHKRLHVPLDELSSNDEESPLFPKWNYTSKYIPNINEPVYAGTNFGIKILYRIENYGSKWISYDKHNISAFEGIVTKWSYIF